MPLIHKVYRLLDAFSTRFCISNVISHCMLLGNNRASLPLFCRCSSEVTPSILHRYSIVSPSFRWTNDGVTMDKRWRNIRAWAGKEWIKIKSKKEKIKSGESRPLALKLIILFIFSFLLYTFSALRSSLSGQS